MRKMTIAAATTLALFGTGVIAGEAMASKGEVDLAKSRVNSDGSIEIAHNGSTADAATLEDVFDAVDIDGSNSITGPEANRLNGLSDVFSRLDKDGDRKLSQTEFETLDERQTERPS